MSKSSERPQLILASSSPRRRELLSAVGVQFDVQPADVVEALERRESGQAMVERLAREKASRIAARFPNAFVLAADTTVVLPGSNGSEVVLEKPKDAADARRMVGLLQGREHLVFTGYALVSTGRGVSEHGSVRTQVICAPLSDDDIAAYVATGEPMDKAGAYGAQGRGSFFVSEYKGSFTNVVGLPVVEVLALLKRHGLWAPTDLPK